MFVSLGVSEKAAVNLYKRGLFLPSHVADVSDVLLRECGVPASKLEKFRNRIDNEIWLSKYIYRMNIFI